MPGSQSGKPFVLIDHLAWHGMSGSEVLHDSLPVLSHSEVTLKLISRVTISVFKQECVTLRQLALECLTINKTSDI